MDPAHMDTGIILTRDENAQWHDLQCKRNAADRQCLNESNLKVLDFWARFSPLWLFGAKGLHCRQDLGLLLDILGPLRSCFDFHGVILLRIFVEIVVEIVM